MHMMTRPGNAGVWQLDYILYNQRFKNQILVSKALPEADTVIAKFSYGEMHVETDKER